MRQLRDPSLTFDGGQNCHVKNESMKVIFCKDRKCFFCLRIKLILHEQYPAMFPSVRAAIFRNLGRDWNVQPLGIEPGKTTIYVGFITLFFGTRSANDNRSPQTAGCIGGASL